MGWEAQILRDGDLSFARTFILWDVAVGWAKNDRDRLEGDDPFVQQVHLFPSRYVLRKRLSSLCSLPPRAEIPSTSPPELSSRASARKVTTGIDLDRRR